MSVINATPLLAAAGGDYQISRSVRLRSSASGYFTRTPSSASGQQTFTISAWVKRGTLSTQQVVFGINSASTNIFTLSFLAGDTLRVFGRNAGSDVLNLTTTAVYRDPSAWYHIVIAIDTTQATSSNRARMYVNGVEVTAFGTATYPAQNTSLAWNSNSYAHDIGRESTGNYFDGYTTEINHISGTQLTPSSFGETDSITGVWKPKKYAGTYGTNGFYLNFSDNSAATAAAIGKDYSGNGNNWTPNNISVTAGVTYDSMLDVPTLYADGGNGRGNYAVLNPLNYVTTLPSGGNLTWNLPSGGSARVYGSMGVSTGKWYFETTITAFNPAPFNGYMLIGISYTPTPSGTGRYTYIGSNDSGIAGYKNNGATSSAYGANYTVGDVVGVAYDLDAGTITFYKNGISQGTAFTGIAAGEYFPVIINDGGASNPTTYNANFGQRPFAYTPPTGFKALNTQNLPEPTIKKGNQYFDATTYTGNGSTQSIVNSGGMQPDLVWGKARSLANSNFLVDAVRGSSLFLSSDQTIAEVSNSSLVSSLNSNGYTVGNTTTANQNAATYVGWQWKESPSAGFDIVTYTGNGANRTIAHSLGVAPRMMIFKRRDAVAGWPVYHASIGNTAILSLQATAATSASATYFNNTSPTSSVFTVSTDSALNANGATYVAYLFAEVAGFSKFGSYTGNGSADGPFVFTGFRPRYVMIKRTDNVGDWWVHDSARDIYNVERNYLMANTSASEAASDNIDFLSNGFKLRVATYQPNTSGGTFIFAAFAENPFKNSLAR